MIGRFAMRRNYFSFCFAPAPKRPKMTCEELMDQLLAETVYHDQHQLRFQRMCSDFGCSPGFYQQPFTLKERLESDEKARLLSKEITTDKTPRPRDMQ